MNWDLIADVPLPAEDPSDAAWGTLTEQSRPDLADHRESSPGKPRALIGGGLWCEASPREVFAFDFLVMVPVQGKAGAVFIEAQAEPGRGGRAYGPYGEALIAV
jgi:hypothetical protein